MKHSGMIGWFTMTKTIIAVLIDSGRRLLIISLFEVIDEFD